MDELTKDKAATSRDVSQLLEYEQRLLSALKTIDDEIHQTDVEYMNLVYVAQKTNKNAPPEAEQLTTTKAPSQGQQPLTSENVLPDLELKPELNAASDEEFDSD